MAKDCINLQTSKPRASGLPHSRTSTSRRTSGHQSRGSGPPGGVDEDSDVDLDFLPDSGVALASHPQQFGTPGKGSGMTWQTPAADAAILQQLLHLEIPSHAVNRADELVIVSKPCGHITRPSFLVLLRYRSTTNHSLERS